VAGLARASLVLVEVSRFVERNLTVEKQAHVIARLQQNGLGQPQEAFVTPRGSRFILFNNRDRKN
jgi:hypothetical protein